MWRVVNILVTFGALVPALNCVSVEYKARYFDNTTLVCDVTLLNLPQYTVYKKWWVLPDGTDIQWSHDPGNTSRYTVSSFPEFNLTINHVTDDEFGWYRCVILWDDYIFLVHSMNIGLNVDGALYDNFLDEYKTNALIGLIAGLGTASLIGLLCLLYWCRYSEVNRVNEDKNEDTDKDVKEANLSTISDSVTEEDITEKEVIYELDKAVKGFDVETEIVNSEIVLINTKQLENNHIDTVASSEQEQSLEPESNEVKAVVTYSQNEFDDNINCYDHIPPPPPPLPPHPHLEDKSEEMNTVDDVVYYNRAFEADDYDNRNDHTEEGAKANEAIDNDTKSADTPSGLDTIKSFTFHEELIARLMGQSKGEGENGDANVTTIEDDDDVERIRF